jgi:C-terminal processing protease CtpA/Prc
VLVVMAACSRSVPQLAVGEASAPTPSPSDAALEDGTLTREEQRSLLAAMIPLIDTHYLFPDIGTKMTASLRDHIERGDYARMSGRRAFARGVTDDLRAISHDVHVNLHYDPGGEEKGRSKAELDQEAALAASSGFVAVERWEGNVAYVRIDAFDQYPTAKGAVEAAYASNMTKVSDASALILDLRENYGGYPETVALLVSYFFDATPVHLNDFWDRDDNSTSQSWTRAKVPGKRFGATRPLFVLTSKRTISGGEEAAYDLQQLKRAVVVGETTAGGANFAPRHKLDEHFTFAVPQGRAINAVTRTNWEGTGVAPDVSMDAEAAPKEALARAVRAVSKRSP